VAVVWDETGRMVALQSVGVAPLRMCAVAGLAAMATAVLITGLVALAPDIPGREWVFIGGEQVLQGYWNGDSVDDIRVVRLDGGRVVGVGAADRARWAKGWTVEGESAQIWVGDEARPMGLSLPAPDVWLEAASSSSSAMTLAVRVHGIVGGGLLAWFAMAMALRGQRGVGIAACALWTLISAVGMSAVATGALSLWTAVLAPLAIAVAAVIYASCRTT
jgi:hypothetical protein